MVIIIHAITKSCQNHASYQHRYLTKLASVKPMQDDRLTHTKHQHIHDFLVSFDQCRNLPSKHWRTCLFLETRRKWNSARKWVSHLSIFIDLFVDSQRVRPEGTIRQSSLTSCKSQVIKFHSASPVSSPTVFCFAKIPFLLK